MASVVGGAEFFEKRIRPVLVERCYACHSAEAGDAGGTLLLDTREGMRAGGALGPALVPSNIKDSLIIEALQYESLEMPPDGKLPDEVIADFVKEVLA